MRRGTKLALATVAVVLLSGFLLYMSSSGRRDNLLFQLFSAAGKYRAMSVDAKAVGAEMRKFAYEVRWDRANPEGPVTYARHNWPEFPPRLKRTKASGIRVRDDRVELEFGGTFLHYGIVVFRDGDGQGLKKLADGVWFYSEDGKASIF